MLLGLCEWFADVCLTCVIPFAPVDVNRLVWLHAAGLRRAIDLGCCGLLLPTVESVETLDTVGRRPPNLSV